MLELYMDPKSVAIAPLILLEEVEADYTISLIDISLGQQNQSDFIAINPKKRVPALVTENGVLTETPAIMIYIAQKFGSSSLLGNHDPFIFAKIQEFNSYLASTVHVAHAHRLRGSRWTDNYDAIEALKNKVPESMALSIDPIENNLHPGSWVMGNVYTICDPYLYAVSSWLEDDGVNTKYFPKVIDHRARVSHRTATKAAISRVRLNEN